MIITDQKLSLPISYKMVCTNVTNFAQKVDGNFGKRGGCLFYEVGCRGPMTRASCNNILWNRQSSKTRSNHHV